MTLLPREENLSKKGTLARSHQGVYDGYLVFHHNFLKVLYHKKKTGSLLPVLTFVLRWKTFGFDMYDIHNIE